MTVAIATQKDEAGNLVIHSMVFPLTERQIEQAKKFDKYLSVRIPEIERELKAEARRAGRKKQGQGDVLTWHLLGSKLRDICVEYSINTARERHWLWESLQNLHASDFIKKKERGKTRNHFEYCCELARFPIYFASRIKWSEWAYFFDSRTVREDRRVTDWLYKKAEGDNSLGRQQFRRSVQKLNKKIEKLDTSVLTEEELFAICDSVWREANVELATAPELRSMK